MKNLRIGILFITGLILYTIVITGMTKYVSTNSTKVVEARLGKTLTSLFTETSDILYLVQNFFEEPQYLIKDKTSEDGVTYFGKIDQKLPELLISYQKENNNHVELIDLNNNKVLYSWAINNEHLKSDAKFVYYELRHPILAEDSAIVGITNGNIVKFDKRNQLVWKNDEVHFHHSLEKDHDGDLIACGREWNPKNYEFQNNNKNFQSSLVDDLIVKVDPKTGKILYKKSVIQILVENGYESLLYANGFVVSDILHLNDIQPARTDTDYWNKGDLLLSLRSLSVVFLYRPETNEILWLRQGPWLSQHDADFVGDHKIGIFGNDVIFDFSNSNELGVLEKSTSFVNDHNDFYLFNLKTDTIEKPFTRFFDKNEINTITSGRSELIDESLIFVEETNSGKILIGDSIDKRIQFVRRIDEENISILNWSRILK